MKPCRLRFCACGTPRLDRVPNFLCPRSMRCLASSAPHSLSSIFTLPHAPSHNPITTVGTEGSEIAEPSLADRHQTLQSTPVLARWRTPSISSVSFPGASFRTTVKPRFRASFPRFGQVLDKKDFANPEQSDQCFAIFQFWSLGRICLGNSPPWQQFYVCVLGF